MFFLFEEKRWFGYVFFFEEFVVCSLDLFVFCFERLFLKRFVYVCCEASIMALVLLS